MKRLPQNLQTTDSEMTDNGRDALITLDSGPLSVGLMSVVPQILRQPLEAPAEFLTSPLKGGSTPEYVRSEERGNGWPHLRVPTRGQIFVT
jgi:hypothetical protein